MRIFNKPDESNWSHILARPETDLLQKKEQVGQMLSDLRTRGLEAVKELTQKYDGFQGDHLRVSVDELDRAVSQVTDELKQAIEVSVTNIARFHESQRREGYQVNTMDGVSCRQVWKPIERVGLYVPGGSAPLLSTVLMLAIPAQIAGCKEIVMCTPADNKGNIDPSILYAARFCGVTSIYKLGGVQAIGSMAYGLGDIPKVDKIFGPGNSWVTMAKQLVTFEGVAIDMPAGPSELMIVADESCNPAFVASDLLSQAEHGSDSQVVMVADTENLVNKVMQELQDQLATLPRRKIAEEALKESVMIIEDDESQIIRMINTYAPEHLILATKNYNELVDRVDHTGSVFLGNYTPESCGDYASGTNHTLPTSGYARAYSGLSLDAFMKSITIQELTKEGMSRLAPAVIEMARAEKLDAHARAAAIRLGSEEENMTIKQATLNPGALVRPNIQQLKAYSSARDEYGAKNAIMLDANENPYGSGINRYPNPSQVEVRDLLASRFQVSPNEIFIGNGSDEAIDLLIRVFCEPRQSRMITLSPSYGMYPVCAAIQDVEVDSVLLNQDFSVNETAISEAIQWNTRLVFLCSPNNPTGNLISIDQIARITDAFAGIVVVDEAYIDFSSGPSAIKLLSEFSNLVILRTYSKAWGLAGARLGLALADERIIQYMNKVRYPYNVNSLSMDLLKKKLMEQTEEQKSGRAIQEIVRERDRLASELSQSAVVEAVFPSDANFLLAKFIDAKKVYHDLLDYGIVVRDRSSEPLCEECLRITVGTQEENNQLLETLKKLS